MGQGCPDLSRKSLILKRKTVKYHPLFMSDDKRTPGINSIKYSSINFQLKNESAECIYKLFKGHPRPKCIFLKFSNNNLSEMRMKMSEINLSYFYLQG